MMGAYYITSRNFPYNLGVCDLSPSLSLHLVPLALGGYCAYDNASSRSCL